MRQGKNKQFPPRHSTSASLGRHARGVPTHTVITHIQRIALMAPTGRLPQPRSLRWSAQLMGGANV